MPDGRSRGRPSKTAVGFDQWDLRPLLFVYTVMETEEEMNRIIHYVRGLIADANLATASHPRPSADHASTRLQTLDHPTYLRRGLVIAGLGADNPPRGHAPRASLRGCPASR